MNCPSCNAKMPEPLVVEDTAYFVCVSCGENVGAVAAPEDLPGPLKALVGERGIEIGELAGGRV